MSDDWWQVVECVPSPEGAPAGWLVGRGLLVEGVPPVYISSMPMIGELASLFLGVPVRLLRWWVVIGGRGSPSFIHCMGVSYGNGRLINQGGHVSCTQGYRLPFLDPKKNLLCALMVAPPLAGSDLRWSDELDMFSDQSSNMGMLERPPLLWMECRSFFLAWTCSYQCQLSHSSLIWHTTFPSTHRQTLFKIASQCLVNGTRNG